MAPGAPIYNIDLVWSKDSNVHVANHRDWFTAYTEFDTHSGKDAGFKVVGVGDVVLKLRQDSFGGKLSKAQSKNQRFGTLVLHDVLYVPDYDCNIVGSPLQDEYSLSRTFQQTTLVGKVGGELVGLMDYVGTKKLWLKGQLKGASSRGKDNDGVITADWADEERQRWEAHKAVEPSPQPAMTAAELPADLNVMPNKIIRRLQQEKTTLSKALQSEVALKQQAVKSLHAMQKAQERASSAVDRIHASQPAKSTIEQEDESAASFPLGTPPSKGRFNTGTETAFMRGAATASDASPSRNYDSGGGTVAPTPAPGYTLAETMWLEQRCGGESNFLNSHGIDVDDPEDRELGMALARALIKREQKAESASVFLATLPAYTLAEQRLVTAQYGGESELVRLLSLYPLKAQHRAVARLWARTRWESQATKDASEEGQGSRELEAVENEVAERPESDVESRAAPHREDEHSYFSTAERNWITKRYRNLDYFFSRFGLTAYEEEDCEQAAEILHQLITGTTSVKALRRRLGIGQAVKGPQKTSPVLKVSSPYGQQMLQRLGWSEGQGLGAAGEGIVEPLQLRQQHPLNKQGIGATKMSKKERNSAEKAEEEQQQQAFRGQQELDSSKNKDVKETLAEGATASDASVELATAAADVMAAL